MRGKPGGGGAQSGRLLSMIVSPHVQRLAQIRPGDRVSVTYYQAIAAQVVNVFSPTSQLFEGVSVNRTETANLVYEELWAISVEPMR